MQKDNSNLLLYIVNVDWYFQLHWLDRAVAAQYKGFDVHVMCTFTNADIRKAFEDLGFTCHDVFISRGNKNPIYELLSFRDVSFKIWEIKPALMHSITVKPNIYSGFVARLFGIPTAYSVTGLGAIFSTDTVTNRCLRQVVQVAYKYSSKLAKAKFLFENSSDLELMVKLDALDRSKVVRISGAGVDIAKFCFVPEPEGCPTSILFAARLLEEKGLRSLVAAVEIIRARGEFVQLNVAGIFDEDCDNAIDKRQIEAWDKQGVINWLGTRDDLPQLISNSSIVCLPTTYGEGIPRILIEASSCGRAVVTTNVSGCNEFVIDGNNGFVVEPNDNASLVEALLRLMASYDLRSAMGLQGRSLVEGQYTNEIVITQTLDIYLELLKGESEH